MHTRPLRTLLIAIACCVPLLAPAASPAATYPTVKSVKPLKVGIGDKLTVSGKNFRKSSRKLNTVVFKRDGGRAVFVKASSRNGRTISVVVPAKLLPFLRQKAGQPVRTRFRIRVLAKRFAKRYTPVKRSPVIGPTATRAGAADDCDGDRIADSVETDDDNDLLTDAAEAVYKTDPCKVDTDGDGASDGWEQHSAIDRNGGATVPSPKRRPYPNALDPADAKDLDSDGDGLSNLEEYVAWATYGANKLPLSYSGGNPASAGRDRVSDEHRYMDRDGNGYLSDFERDADGDRIPNMDEMRTSFDLARGSTATDPSDPRLLDVGLFGALYLSKFAEVSSKQKEPLCAGINQVPFYCLEGYTPASPTVSKVDTLDWIEFDTDGDGVRDDADDVDHDDVANITEYLEEVASPVRLFRHLDACVPDIESRFCLVGTVDADRDGVANRDDDDDDGDQLADVTEEQVGTKPLLWDTDGDLVGDGYEYWSALDLNSLALPYPGKAPYPNPLDKDDAQIDHDGDALSLADEYKAWRYTGSPLPLSYSDGRQWTGGKTPASGPLAPMDENGDGTISDDEKDVDDDGASNWTEARGPLSGPDWWDKWIASSRNKCSDEYTETVYPGPKYRGLSFVDPDSDGDGLKDGADDIDHDGLTNAFEALRPGDWCATYISSTHNWPGPPPSADKLARVQPFNPCKPIYSDACHIHPPLNYYAEDQDSGWVEDWDSPYTTP